MAGGKWPESIDHFPIATWHLQAFMSKQAAGRPSSFVDAVARCSRRWFQGKTAAQTAFVSATGSTPSRKQTSPERFHSKSVASSCAQLATRCRLDKVSRSTSHDK